MPYCGWSWDQLYDDPGCQVRMKSVINLGSCKVRACQGACQRGPRWVCDKCMDLGNAYILWLWAAMLVADAHTCQLPCLEHTYILHLLTAMLAVDKHICWLAFQEHAYILCLFPAMLAVDGHICQLACAYIPF